MYSSIERCHNQGVSYSEHCSQTGIHYATFNYWIKKYRRAQAKQETGNTPTFLPLHVEACPKTTSSFIITYPSGTSLECPSDTPVAVA